MDQAFVLIFAALCWNFASGELDPTTCGFKRMRQGTGSGDASKIEWPWMAAVMEYPPRSRTPDFLCSGTLISEAHILTAAHCFDPRPLDPRNYAVYLETDTTEKGEEFNVAFVDLHPQYDPATRYFDLALITLRQDVSNETTPVCLPLNGDQYNHRLANVLEWRTNPNGPQRPRIFQSIRALTSTNPLCERNYYTAKSPELPTGIIPEQLCTASRGPQGSCARFNGAPMVVADRNYQWYLVGLASFREKCSGVGYPGVYTRVTEFTDWIRGTARI